MFLIVFSNPASFPQIIVMLSHSTLLLKVKTRWAVFPLGLATELYLYFWFSTELPGFDHCLSGANSSGERECSETNLHSKDAFSFCFFNKK